MIAGQLTEKIEIYTSHLTKNDVGEQVNKWILKNSTKAHIINNSGVRSEENNEIVYTYTKIFEVRIYIDIDEFDRIKYKNKYYRILNIDTNKDLQKIAIHTELVNE